MAKEPKPPLDPETTRCLKELRSLISGIEAGDLALRRYCDDLTDRQDGLHREVTILVTLIPKKGPTS